MAEHSMMTKSFEELLLSFVATFLTTPLHTFILRNSPKSLCKKVLLQAEQCELLAALGLAQPIALEHNKKSTELQLAVKET